MMKIAIIGAGNMGGAIARAIAGNFNEAVDLTVTNPSAGKLQALCEEFPHIKSESSNERGVRDADVVIIAVKPWVLDGVVEEIAPVVTTRTMIVSVVAGCDAESLSGKFVAFGAENVTTFYCIPNTAIAVGAGMTFYSSHNAGANEEAIVEKIFGACGKCERVDAMKMGAGMAVASCGIAYALRYIRAAMEGGVELGLTPKEAMNAVCQTLVGASALLEANGTHPESEIDKVTTPGGLTIRGLNAMEQAGFSASVVAGLLASK